MERGAPAAHLILVSQTAAQLESAQRREGGGEHPGNPETVLYK